MKPPAAPKTPKDVLGIPHLKTFLKTETDHLPRQIHRHVAYLHVPKTGGTYLKQTETTGQPIMPALKILSHVYFTETDTYFEQVETVKLLNSFVSTFVRINLIHHYPYFVLPLQEARQYFMLTSVRNPFSWFVSQIEHRLRVRSQNPQIAKIGSSLDKGFDYVLRSYAEASQAAGWPNQGLLFCQLFSEGGHFVPDWIMRMETLDEDLATFARLYGFEYNPGPHQNVGEYRDYRTYYTDDLVDLVYQTWGRELALYGYTFDGLDMDRALIKHYTPPQEKLAIHHHPEGDELRIHGTLVPKDLR